MTDMRKPTPVLLDTSVIEAQDFRFDNPRFQRLAELCQFRVARLLVPRVIDREVISHMWASSVDIRASLKRASEKARKIYDPGQGGPVGQGSVPSREDLFKVLTNRYSDYKESCSATFVPDTDRNIDEIVNWHFDGRPPFKSKGCDKSWRDAIALGSANSWALRTGTEVCLVSGDDDWERFNSTSRHTILFKTIDSLISYLVRQWGLRAFNGDREAWSDYLVEEAQRRSPIHAPVSSTSHISTSTNEPAPATTFGDLLDYLANNRVNIAPSTSGTSTIRTRFLPYDIDLLVKKFPNRLKLYLDKSKTEDFEHIKYYSQEGWSEEDIFHICVIKSIHRESSLQTPFSAGGGISISNWNTFIEQAYSIMTLPKNEGTASLSSALRQIYSVLCGGLEAAYQIRSIEIQLSRTATG